MVVAVVGAWALAPAAWAENTFEVANIHVDASGKSVEEARISAIAAGRPVAWATLFRRLTRQADWTRQPVIDPAQMQKMVIGYFPINERRSTTRYVADVTYTFNPEAVARVLQAANIPYTSVAAKRILLVPLAPGYARNSAWTQAFASPRFAMAAVPFGLPPGDAADAAALNGLNIDTATWDHLAPVAAKLKASEAVLVLAQAFGNKLILSVKRVGAGELPVKQVVEVPLLQNVVATYPGAADAVMRVVDDMSKNQKVVDYSQKGKLIADLRVASLAQFAAVESTLSAVPNVSNVNVAAMDIGQARLVISYLGSPEQLKAALSQAGLVLSQRGGAWQLSAGTALATP
ncbi:hypothetical protein GCM10008941_23340 [Rhizomicrobium palustre]